MGRPDVAKPLTSPGPPSTIIGRPRAVNGSPLKEILKTYGATVANPALPLAALLQNRREMRVRNSIANNIKIINDISGAKLANEQALITTFEGGLQSDVSVLAKLIEDRNQEKKRDWASLFVAIFLAAIITIPLGSWGDRRTAGHGPCLSCLQLEPPCFWSAVLAPALLRVVKIRRSRNRT